MTRIFKLNKIHADNDVTLEVNEELLTLTLLSGNVYESGEFIDMSCDELRSEYE